MKIIAITGIIATLLMARALAARNPETTTSVREEVRTWNLGPGPRSYSYWSGRP